MNKDEALKMAIDLLESMKTGAETFQQSSIHIVCSICEEALEAEQIFQAQEPVAYLSEDKKSVITRLMRVRRTEDEMNGKVIKDFPMPLYTHPHQWQGLTDEEIRHCLYEFNTQDFIQFARAIEQALKDKNT
jgi:hypothetical protein